MKKYFILFIYLLVLSCKSNKETHVNTTQGEVGIKKEVDNYRDVYKNDTSIYIIYSNLIYSDTACPDKKLWSKVELYKNGKIILIDSSVLVSPTFGWSHAGNNIIYSYRQMMIGLDDFVTDANVKKNFCTQDVPLFAHIDYDVTRETEFILCNAQTLDIAGSQDDLSRKGYQFDTLLNAWIGINSERDTIYSLGDIIAKDNSIMQRNEESIPEKKIVQYVSLVEENDLINTGYNKDFLSLFRLILQYGTPKEKDHVAKFLE